MTKTQKEYKMLILSDLRIADNYKDSIDKSDRLMAAYHVQQAIEKTIKLYAELNGLNLWGHNIGLLIKACDAEGLDIEIPKLIRKNADVYTRWEADCRYYPVKIVRKDTLNKAYYCIREWAEKL